MVENNNNNQDQGSNISQENFSKIDRLKFFLSNPKNLLGSLLLAVLIVIIVFNLFFKSTKIKQVNTPTQIPQTEVNVPKPAQIDVENKDFTPEVSNQNTTPLDPIELPPLPNLDIDVLDKINAVQSNQQQSEIDIIDIEKLRNENKPPQIEEVDDFYDEDDFTQDVFEEAIKPVRPKKIRKIDPENPPIPILIGSGGGPTGKTKNKIVSDFIFVDSSIGAEDSQDLPNQGRRLPNLGNLVAQGRVIDAILETAINSGVPGAIRAVISRDVYAEAGRSILIPKGTRLYGSYGTGNINSGRLLVTWSRLLRPDGISVGISSFGADQFGRAGVKGNVNKKYAETITSALLLSAIPLVGTVVAQKATGGRVSDTTVVSGGTITTTSDPINKATVDFTQQLSDATGSIIRDLIDTTVIVTIDQGTRIKVLVNQDLELVAYKPLTALNTTISYSSQ